MPTIMPQSELVRRAVEWIMSNKSEKKPMHKLVDEAGMRFNLTPAETESLIRILSDTEKETN